MKTRIRNFATTLFVAAFLSPSAFARPDFPPIHWSTSNSVAKSAAFDMTNKACKGVSCCTTKTLTSLTGNGKSTIWRTVLDCGKACPVSKTDKSSVCREGDRA